MAAVVVYTTPTCPWCRAVKDLLSQKGVAFREIDVSRNPVAAAEMIRRSGQRGVPVTTIDEEVIVGFDRTRLEQALDRAAAAPPRLGAAITDAAPFLAKQGKQPIEGVYVGRVTPGSPADGAGLLPGDVILRAAGNPLSRAADLEAVIAAGHAGAVITVAVNRGGDVLLLPVRL